MLPNCSELNKKHDQDFSVVLLIVLLMIGIEVFQILENVKK